MVSKFLNITSHKLTWLELQHLSRIGTITMSVKLAVCDPRTSKVCYLLSHGAEVGNSTTSAVMTFRISNVFVVRALLSHPRSYLT